MQFYTKYPEYGSMIKRKRRFFYVFVIVAAAMSILTIGINRYTGLDFIGCFETLFDHISGNPSTVGNDDFVVWERMVPRSILGVCVGAALGLGGAVMQIILHNPLADPYNTGISSGAGLGATLFIVMGIAVIPGLSYFASIVVNAFVFSLVPTALIIILSQFRKMTPSQMILIGIAVMFFFGAANTIMMLLADPTDLQGAFMWTMGNLGNAEWAYMPLVVCATILGSVAIMFLHKKLNLLTGGDTYTMTLGENPLNIRRLILVLVSLMVAVVVSFSGTIGFVGIIAPHVVRMVLGSDTRYLLPASMAMGATIMLLADSCAKLLIMPVGVVTSIIGAPMFLFILLRMRRGEYA